MTRKEQIESASVQCCEQIGFIVGAEWSDENPKEGLVNINKACEYLKANIQIPENVGNWYVENFIQQFRKAMEK